MRVLIPASALLLTLTSLALVPAQPPAGEYVKKGTRADTVRATLASFGRPNLEGTWYYCGPFDNSDRQAFDTAFPPEKKVDLKANYTGKRYYTYINDGAVPSYWLFNASAAYDVGKLGVVQDLKLAINVTNLADKKYFGSIGTNGFVASDPQGQFATMQVGAPRAAMLTATLRF